MMSQLVSPATAGNQRQQVEIYGLSPDLYKVYAVGSARVYHTHFGAKHNEWTFSRLKGLLVFGKDRDMPGGEVLLGRVHASLDTERYWFRLIDEASCKTVWMFKVPNGFEYHLDRPFFHVFAGRSRMFGLLFDNDDEAEALARKVIDRTCPNMLIARSRNTRKPSFSARPRRLSPSMISSPNPDTFVHVAHVSVNKNGVIETSKGVDPSWTRILADLQGKGISQNVVLENINFSREALTDVEGIKRSISNSTSTTEEGQQVTEKTQKPRRKPPPSLESV